MQRQRQFRLATVFATAAICLTVLLSNTGKLQAFNQQPDPPGFGIVGMNPDQFMRFGVRCSDLKIAGAPPGPCRGVVRFADGEGLAIKVQSYELAPGQAGFVDLLPDELNWRDGNRIEISPGIIPSAGRAMPVVELVGSTTGKTEVYVLPIAPRVSRIEDLR